MQYSALFPALTLLASLKLSFLINLLFLLAFQYLSFSKSQHQVSFRWCCVSTPATAPVSTSCYSFAMDALVFPLCLPCNTMSSEHNTLLCSGSQLLLCFLLGTSICFVSKAHYNLGLFSLPVTCSFFFLNGLRSN